MRTKGKIWENKRNNKTGERNTYIVKNQITVSFFLFSDNVSPKISFS